jgi:ABC-2 type transport system ATP-binding protein
MSDLCVDVKNLTRRFGDFVAVDNVSFQIPRGSIFGFLGPNGAGKSTTIRMLLGILPISSGSGTVLGFNLATQSQLIRSKVGYMSQKFSLYEDMTVVENLSFFAGIFGLSAAKTKERLDYLLELCRLKGYENNLAFNLPGGIRQRLSFAVSLLHEPEIVFLDEPTGAVDPALRRYFWDIIVQLGQQGTTVMVTTHYMDEVERCHDICFIAQGKLIAQGSPHQLKSNSIQGKMYSLRPRARLEALNELKSMKGVSNSYPAGAEIRLLVPSSSLGNAERERLIALSVDQSLLEVLPNLEDVFIALQSQPILEKPVAAGGPN